MFYFVYNSTFSSRLAFTHFDPSTFFRGRFLFSFIFFFSSFSCTFPLYIHIPNEFNNNNTRALALVTVTDVWFLVLLKQKNNNKKNYYYYYYYTKYKKCYFLLLPHRFSFNNLISTVYIILVFSSAATTAAFPPPSPHHHHHTFMQTHISHTQSNALPFALTFSISLNPFYFLNDSLLALFFSLFFSISFSRERLVLTCAWYCIEF